jgi:hypothetical protein
MYKTELLESPMAAPMRKTVAAAASSNGDRRYPPEAYTYDDDVTPEAVATMRKKASKIIDSEKWEVVDGFGTSSAY